MVKHAVVYISEVVEIHYYRSMILGYKHKQISALRHVYYSSFCPPVSGFHSNKVTVRFSCLFKANAGPDDKEGPSAKLKNMLDLQSASGGFIW